MSICSSGLSSPGPLQPVTIAVAPTHPLIQLAQVIPWQALAQLDLQHTTAKSKWWIGRKLQQSRMKKDESTLAAGYASIGGFNLRQLIRHLLGKDIKAMA